MGFGPTYQCTTTSATLKNYLVMNPKFSKNWNTVHMEHQIQRFSYLISNILYWIIKNPNNTIQCVDKIFILMWNRFHYLTNRIRNPILLKFLQSSYLDHRKFTKGYSCKNILNSSIQMLKAQIKLLLWEIKNKAYSKV